MLEKICAVIALYTMMPLIRPRRINKTKQEMIHEQHLSSPSSADC